MIEAIDLHACGEPGRVIVGGVPDVPGTTMFEKMQYLATRGDGLRKLMLREPRGYPATCCNLILPSSHPEAAAGYVIMEQVEYPGMSGTNTICVVTALLETGRGADARAGHGADPGSPGGTDPRPGGVRERQGEESDLPQRAGLRHPPGRPVEVPHLGTVTVDVAYGGMFYVIADAAPVRPAPDPRRRFARSSASAR